MVPHIHRVQEKYMNEQSNISSSPFGRLTARTKGDKVIWSLVIMLTMASLLVVYSSTGTLAYAMEKSTEFYLFKQVVFISIGILVIYFAHLVNSEPISFIEIQRAL
jgi:cell division protein FtsW (lipid II flippase)